MRNLRDYSVITGSYWVFTLTDGAMRTLILFHLHQLGYSPLQVVSLFLFYELFGVFTNLTGGWLGARFGLKATLFVGLALQVLACSTLAVMAESLTVPIVMIAQAVCGIAKDLTKMSSKSYVKFVVPETDTSALMKWVALLTGSKNALKGVGFLLGGLLLQTVGFRTANIGMAIALIVALTTSVAMLPRAPGKSKTRVAFRDLVAKDARVNWLSAARLFLFGSRDIWFVFALPIFLSVNLGWSFTKSSAFLAVWVIGYGVVQALAPGYVGRGGASGSGPNARTVIGWTGLLLVPLGSLATLLHFEIMPTISLIVGLAIFGAIFATNSAIHSFLIVHYADGDKVSLNVGFYYMANAAGRLVGTILSGAVFQLAGMGTTGLVACVATSAGFVVVSSLFCLPLRKAELHHRSRAVKSPEPLAG